MVDGRYGNNVLLGGLLLRVLATYDMYRSEMTQQRFAEPKATSWPCRAAVYLLNMSGAHWRRRALHSFAYNAVLHLLYKDYGRGGLLLARRCDMLVEAATDWLPLVSWTPTPAPPMSQQKSEVCPKGVLAAVGDVQETCMHPVACVSYICHAESMHCTADVMRVEKQHRRGDSVVRV